jgi:SMODS-associating 2TM, beta-strand rich effector domain
MKRTIIIRVIAAVVVAVFVAGAWLTSGQLDLGWLRFFSAAVLLATLVLGLWDVWLWRLPPIQRIPGVPRCVRGTWRGTLTSLWVNPATGESPPPKTLFLVVRQTATLVSVTLLTDESKSTSSLASVNSVDGAAVLTYLYLNRPDMRVEHRSRMHHVHGAQYHRGTRRADARDRRAPGIRDRIWAGAGASDLPLTGAS